MKGEGRRFTPAGFSFVSVQLAAAPLRVFTISGLSTRSACRLSARRVAMRANSMGPPRSAALVIISAAVRMTGAPRSDDGTVLTRWTIASRNDPSLTPPGSSIGSAKQLSQDTMQLRKRTAVLIVDLRFRMASSDKENGFVGTGIQTCAGRFVPVAP
jgi:hypothetical protein